MTRIFQHETDKWFIQLAGPDDNEALCDLFRKVHLPASLELAQERDPDFFAMLRMHAGGYHSYIICTEDGTPGACASMPRRTAWYEGDQIPSSYLCDLRILPEHRGRGRLGRGFQEIFKFAKQEYGGELFTTVVFDTNTRAKKALVTPKGDQVEKLRKEQPEYREMTRFNMTSVHFTTPKKGPSARVKEATTADRDELFQFIIDGQRRRLLGECLDGDMLNQRIETWPGFSLSDFLIVRNQKGRIAGCLAPWDTGAFKRTRVIDYHGSMAVIRRGYDLMAKLRGYLPLPAPGECFRFSFLTHLEIADDDPALLQDLLRGAYQRLSPTGAHYMAAMIPRESKLEKAFSDFMVTRTAMTVYAVHPRNSRYSGFDFRTIHPGFEMALS